ncbi:amino acid transporter [Durotheca rogersii]|uniref:amino acid transporter n=1 Tax=Durotheca rogersii TaxID=419775 RepID=UPI00221FF4D5|nr:amino acid transporter [Durotheca rogersii]KAI5863700.1 amino acid transporter [Durotheca rogersii]
MGLPNFWSRPTVSEVPAGADANVSSTDVSVLHDGNLAYTVEKAGNGSKPSYQEVTGAPVESRSPLGYHVGWLTVIFLNVNQMIGTGIFSTPGTILNRTGSIGLALIYWTIGVLLAIAGFSVYLELASYFPNRSGSEVVYLEQEYPRPKHFFPITFAVFNVLLSFSSSNAIVLARYLFRAAGQTPTDWQLKGVAVAAYTLASLCVILHNKYSLWLMNFLGVLKIITLIFTSITGLVVLGGNLSHIPDPGANFRNAFEGTTTNGNDLAVALVNILFSYAGYTNAFNLVNEIKNPIRTLKIHGAISISIVSLLYMLCNIAYFAAVPKEEFASSREIAAAVFFVSVFGRGGAEKALNVLVLLSAFGNLLAVLIGQSRVIREIGRQGTLPFTKFWVSTKPFGTPIGPYILKWAMTLVMILAPPAGDAFQFIISLRAYPDGIFNLFLAFGVYLVRHRHKRLGRSAPEFRAWHIVVIFYILIQVYVLATPWIPPKGGPYAGEVSFWYATYCVVGIAIIIVCALYYVFWMHLLPKWKGYEIRQEILNVENEGANTHRLVKVPLQELGKWDEEHDEAGRLRRRHHGASARSSDGDDGNDQHEPKAV